MSFPPRPGMVPGMPVTHVMSGSPYVHMSVQPMPGMMPNVGMPMPSSGPMMQHSMGYSRPGPGMRPPMMGPGLSQTTVSAPPQIRSHLAMRHTRAMHMSSSQGKQLQGGTLPTTFDDSSGPTVTVFVGNITERAPDILVRQMLNACGPVLAWKRVQGASGKLQAFGFCEFTNPDSGLRAIRLLHDFQLADKKLVVKVDAKTKDVLFKFKGDKKKELRGDSSSSDAAAETEDMPDSDYMSEDMKKQDSAVLGKLSQLLMEFKAPMENYQPNTPREPRNKRVVEVETHEEGTRGVFDPPASDLNITEDQMLDEEQKELISREIGKFREIMKLEEAKEKEKEKDRTRSDTRKKPSDSDRSGDKSKDVKPKKEKSPTPSAQESDKSGFGGSTWAARKRSKTRSKSRSKSRSPSVRSRTRRLEGSSRDRRDDRRGASRDRDSRRRDRDRDRDRDRERGRDREDRREDTTRDKEREAEEEQREREKEERRMQEKEEQYQERLRKWEVREKSKASEYKREKDKERGKKSEMEKEANRLLQFLQDYDDDRDDDKYYKARELQRRMNERKTEEELDKKDRQKEKEELEELCARIVAEGHANPEAEFQRIKAQRDAKYKPTILVPIPTRENEDDEEGEKEKEKTTSKKGKSKSRKTSGGNKEESKKNGVPNGEAAPVLITPKSPENVETPPFVPLVGRSTSNIVSDPRVRTSRSPAVAVDSGSPNVISRGTPSNRASSRTPGESTIPVPAKDKQPLMTVTGRKRVVGVQQAFAEDEDEDDGEFGRRKRSRKVTKQEVPVAVPGRAPSQTTPVADQSGKTPKTPVVPHDDASMEALVLESYDDGRRSASGTPAGSSSRGKGDGDPKRHMKEIIARIPSDKTALFGHRIEWNAVDQNMMQKRIKPWVNKKMIEYIGEEEPTLVDFICQKIMRRSTPKEIMADVQMVLDEEAEVFVTKLWRLLIYEVEAKKLGMGI